MFTETFKMQFGMVQLHAEGLAVVKHLLHKFLVKVLVQEFFFNPVMPNSLSVTILDNGLISGFQRHTVAVLVPNHVFQYEVAPMQLHIQPLLHKDTTTMGADL